MDLTKEEKMMYEIMRAIYVSEMPISFKGSMVLKAFLMEVGYDGQIRHTVDIDANWNSNDKPTIEQIAKSIQQAIDKNGLELIVKAYRDYNLTRSAGFELINKSTNEILFTIDMDVNRSNPLTKVYEITNYSFRGVVPNQMLADKLYVASTDKIFRRIKDFIDLYYLSNCLRFEVDNILEILAKSNRSLGDFNGFLNRKNDLIHSYEKFRFAGNIERPAFEDMYAKVRMYIADLLPR